MKQNAVVHIHRIGLAIWRGKQNNNNGLAVLNGGDGRVGRPGLAARCLRDDIRQTHLGELHEREMHSGTCEVLFVLEHFHCGLPCSGVRLAFELHERIVLGITPAPFFGGIDAQPELAILIFELR
jgi:hypothetical protein